MEEIHLKIGDIALDFVLNDLNGETHSVAQAHDRILVLNFWSAECPWAERVDRDLLPRISEWDDAVWYYTIASNANEPEELVRRVAAERSIPLVLLDPNLVAANRYGVLITPHFFIVDRMGVLRYQGAYDNVNFRQRKPTRQFLIPAVQALLEGRQPDPAEVPSFGCTLVRYNE